ncbi:uncharacterized protein BROUX77_000510 [Berkeleyomyces rouxiae]|uniref:uncharacterized protein n=1 Tax=Berkeleyomyces rouxiae TaxID=2035830 RepID=UPI003B807B36
MDLEDNTQPTQATQNVLDPRRIAGTPEPQLSDESISTIICFLHPCSSSALAEVDELAKCNSPLVTSTPTDIVYDPRFADMGSDNAAHLDLMLPLPEHSIMLELSSPMKDPKMGFVFGRNTTRCDVCITNDPKRRMSNAHFRIYVNEYGVVMLEDTSTNGTVVSGDLLKGKGGNPDRVRRMLTSGSYIKVLMHEERFDLLFSVRIPKREGSAQARFLEKVAAFRNAHIMPPPFLPNQQQSPRNIFDPRNRAGAAAKPPAQQWQLPRVPAAKGSADLEPWDGAGQYNRAEYVGKGAFAMVYKVTDRFNGTPYAAKELDKRRFIKNGVLDEKVENEMKIMRKVRHQNIVQYINHFDWQSRQLIIIMEYVQGGDLGKYVHEVGPLPEAVARELSWQMLGALQYLHEKNITHRDVKPDNILISSTSPFTVKLTDFGLSKMVDNDQTFLRTFCGTLLYCAPEVYSEFVEYDLDGRRHPQNRALNRRPGQRYGHAVDVWSLAGVIFYVLTGGPPFPAANGISHTELLHQVMTRPFDVRPLLIRHVSQSGIHFLQSMLQPRPENRATIEQLLSHKWLAAPAEVAPLQPQVSAWSSDEVSEDELDLDDVAEIIQSKAPPKADIESDYEDVKMTDSFLENIANHNNNKGPAQRQNQNTTFGRGPAAVQNISPVDESGVLPPVLSNDSAFDSNDSNSAQDDTVTLQDKGGLKSPAQPPHHSLLVQDEQEDFNTMSDAQSADQVLSLVEGVASQSLNSHHQNNTYTNNDMLSVSLFTDFNASKRKPCFDSSDEFTESNHKANLPPVKRARSDMPRGLAAPPAPLATVTSEQKEEYRLLSQIPSVNRLESGRQIDMPVHKSRFWDQDRSTYHLNYPEMTQLQMTAFKHAATERGEVFEPGQTPLWHLAMKYFGPTDLDQAPDAGDLSLVPNSAAVSPVAPLQGVSTSDAEMGGAALAPSTQAKDGRMLALLESTADSAVSDINIKVQDSVLTWGRSPDNLLQYPTLSETRIPKTAFRMLLWAPNYDASNDRPQNVPWVPGQNPAVNEQEYHFYISTKATRGICINNALLQSHNHAVFNSESRFWVRLHNGDELMLWGSGKQVATKVVFRCFWGGSATDRADNTAPGLVEAATAHQLDEISLRAEKRRLDWRFYEARETEANRDYDRRVRCISREREKSTCFEEVRRRAVEWVTAQKGGAQRGKKANPQVTALAAKDMERMQSV